VIRPCAKPLVALTPKSAVGVISWATSTFERTWLKVVFQTVIARDDALDPQEKVDRVIMFFCKWQGVLRFAGENVCKG